MIKNAAFSSWCRSTLSGMVGTVIGIILTFGSNALVNNFKQKKTEHLIALKVLDDINMRKNALDNTVKLMEKNDSLFHVFYKIEDRKLLYQMDKDSLELFFNSFLTANFNMTNHSVEQIFSSNFSVWENVSNSEFLTSVGSSYSALNYLESKALEINKKRMDFFYELAVPHLNDFESAAEAVDTLLASPQLRFFIGIYHPMFVGMMRMGVLGLDEMMKRNMELLDIKEEDLDSLHEGGLEYKHSMTRDL